MADIITITESTTWTVPEGVTAVDVLVVAGGGGIAALISFAQNALK